jgi:dTDP-4-amino-4,6-dideoxygalactose transaminase
VALGQLEKLHDCVRNRTEHANALTKALRGVPGIRPFPTHPDATNVYWKYCLLVDADVIPDGAIGLAKLLKLRGISSAPRYIQKPAFMCEIFQKKRTFGKSEFPFTLARPEVLHYNREQYPKTFAGLEHTLVLPWNERYTSEHVDYIAASVREVVASVCETVEA